MLLLLLMLLMLMLLMLMLLLLLLMLLLMLLLLLLMLLMLLPLLLLLMLLMLLMLLLMLLMLLMPPISIGSIRTGFGGTCGPATFSGDLRAGRSAVWRSPAPTPRLSRCSAWAPRRWDTRAPPMDGSPL